MNKLIIRSVLFAFALSLLASCGDEAEPQYKDAKSTPMTFRVSHPAKTRATSTDFESGDRIGLYVSGADKPLEIGGNLVNNEVLAFDGSTWSADHFLFWDEGSYNAFAYYPYIKDVSSIEDQPFSVALDQSSRKTASELGGYEASDLLFATAKNVKASDSPVSLNFRHIMSKLTIRLIKGEDFDGEMPKTAVVYVHSTVPTATIDLQAGIVTREVKGVRKTIIAHQDEDDTYSAIIVSQRIDNRMPLVEVEMKGVSYFFESKFHFKPGMEHLVNLIISDNPDKVKINIGGEKVNWD